MREYAIHRCGYKAATEAGFCRMHDPAECARRATARGPSKYRRWVIACNATDAAVAQLPGEHRETIARLLAEERSFR